MSCGLATSELDRVVTLRKPATDTDAYGQPVPGFVDVATVYANCRPATPREYVASRQAESAIDAVFKIRWRGDVQANWILIFEPSFQAQQFDIQGLAEIGRRLGLQIYGRARQP
jgi:SPP1 family predicted phage head-tail adaptor